MINMGAVLVATSNRRPDDLYVAVVYLPYDPFIHVVTDDII
jgi:predicted ATPase